MLISRNPDLVFLSLWSNISLINRMCREQMSMSVVDAMGMGADSQHYASKGRPQAKVNTVLVLYFCGIVVVW